jgi:glutamine synthetase
LKVTLKFGLCSLERGHRGNASPNLPRFVSALEQRRLSAPAGKELEFYLFDCRLKRFPVIARRDNNRQVIPLKTGF